AFATVLALAFAATAFSAFAGPNRVPTAQSVSIALGANITNSIVLQGSDPDGDPLTFTVTSPPSRGTLTGTAPNLTYTPFVNFLGTDRLTFVVSDRRSTSSPATVSITVTPGLVPENVSIFEGNSGTVNLEVELRVTAGVTNASVSYSTIDGTAKAGSDYVAAGGKFGGFGISGPGSIGLVIRVNGDTDIEQNESFLVQLFNP